MENNRWRSRDSEEACCLNGGTLEIWGCRVCPSVQKERHVIKPRDQRITRQRESHKLKGKAKFKDEAAAEEVEIKAAEEATVAMSE